MKLNAKLKIGMLATSVLVGSVWMTGCEKPPVAAPDQTTGTFSNGAEISVSSFTLEKPYYVNNDHKISSSDQDVAILRLKIKATKGDLKYNPLHDAENAGRVQIWSMEKIDQEDTTNNKFGRIEVAAYKLGGNTATLNQHTSNGETIAAGSEIIDEYLFKIPAAQKLYAVIPGAIVNDSGDVRILIDAPQTVNPPAPAGLNQSVTFNDISIKVTKVANEYAELAPRNPPAQPLKYAYAYTANPVLSVYVSITNNGKTKLEYNPSHTADVSGVRMLVGNQTLKRVKVGNTDVTGKQVGTVVGKGQVSDTTIAPGATLTDVYFFEEPAADADLSFSLSGELFKTKGYFQFLLPYKKSTLAQPDLEPYKHANQADNAEDSGEPADNAEEPAEETAEETAEQADDKKE